MHGYRPNISLFKYMLIYIDLLKYILKFICQWQFSQSTNTKIVTAISRKSAYFLEKFNYH